MTGPRPDTQGRYWRVWVGVTVVFVCGLLVGVVATRAYHDYQRQHRWEQGLAGMKPRVMKHLTHDLHLSAEQRQAVERVVTQAEAELLRLRLAQQPQVDATIVRTTDAIKATLDSDQQRRLDELYRALQRRWNADREYVRGLQAHLD